MDFKNNTDQVLRTIAEAKIVPVVKIEDAEQAVPLAHAILDGGLNIVEVTFRSEAAAKAIEKISREVPEIFVGAGTVINPALAKSALDAGAKFIVSPGLNLATVEFAKEASLPIVPGVATASEIEQALMMDLNVLKLFPAKTLGGPELLKAFAGPFGAVKFLPTGGIGQDNFMDYLALKNVIAVGGSWMVKGDLAQVTSLVRSAVEKRDGVLTV